MALTSPSTGTSLIQLVRRELLRLARREYELADLESAKVPYWLPCPVSVLAHRAAARALEDQATALVNAG